MNLNLFNVLFNFTYKKTLNNFHINSKKYENTRSIFLDGKWWALAHKDKDFLEQSNALAL